MAFVIYVKNEGDTATVRVFQRLNNNESKVVFEDVIENDGRVPVDALKTDDYGDAAGEFLWEHEGSGLTDQQVISAGDELLVK